MPIESYLPAILGAIAVIFVGMIAIVAFLIEQNKRLHFIQAKVDRRFEAINKMIHFEESEEDKDEKEEEATPNRIDPEDEKIQFEKSMEGEEEKEGAEDAATDEKIQFEESVEGEEEKEDAATDENVGDEKSPTDYGPIDLKKKYEEAFNESGGEEALKLFEDVSDDLKNAFTHKVLVKEIEKILPQSVEWIGASNVILNQSYVRTLYDLYEKAGEAHDIFSNAIEEIAYETNSKAIVPDIKSRRRAIEKAKFKYSDKDGNGVAYYRLTDIVRGALVFGDIAEMYKGLEVVRKCEHFTIVKFNDRFRDPIPNAGNYRDLVLTVKVKECNFLCEMQMNTQRMIEVKQTFGHREYEVYRRLKAAVQDRDIDQIHAVLAFCKEQQGSSYNQQENLLPPLCHLLIHDAAKMGDTYIVDFLLENGVDVNIVDDEKNTALHYAVCNGHERCVWLLLDKYDCNKSIVNMDGETALMAGYVKCYSQPSEQTRRAVATLLQKTDLKDIEKTTADFPNVIRSKLRKRRELVDSAADRDMEKMRDLLRNYADPNSSRDGHSALEEAIQRRNAEAVTLLVEFGVAPTRHELELAVTQGYDIARILIVHVTRRPNLLFPQNFIQTNVKGHQKWSDITCYGKKVFCAPFNASDILVIDASSEMMHLSPCGVEGGSKWRGITCCGKKLFCAPYNSSEILVIDGET
eukprot:CAMPEP_0116132926 /NCGR_PEP_ID=MMETSP0329-20121206/9821_1 /TAXON_ID=697910 /ORGANISM="Pseudo-nitzschia arenysensis, Strain B593" /LENGTH=689 /DNA_ID=CAMNT_0003627499 /DNA_START=1 /DNA_END=2066 /DNA_ORIENTATION=-